MKNTKSQKIHYPQNVVILVILHFLKNSVEDKYLYNIYCTVPPECSNVSNLRNVVVSKRTWLRGQYLSSPIQYKIKSVPVECSNVSNVVCPGWRIQNL